MAQEGSDNVVGAVVSTWKASYCGHNRTLGPINEQAWPWDIQQGYPACRLGMLRGWRNP
jgi:hypothetical protein